MRDLINIVESLDLNEAIAFQYMGRYSEKAYPVYRNANASVLAKLINSTPYDVRGLLDLRRGDLYFWDANAAVHVTIRNELGLVDALHLLLRPDSIFITPSRRAGDPSPRQEDKETVAGNRNVKRVYGADLEVYLDSDYDDEE